MLSAFLLLRVAVSQRLTAASGKVNTSTWLDTVKGQERYRPRYFICGAQAKAVDFNNLYTCAVGRHCCKFWCLKRCTTWGTCSAFIRRQITSLKLTFCNYRSWYDQTENVLVDNGFNDNKVMCPENYYVVDFFGAINDEAGLNGLSFTCKRMGGIETKNLTLVSGYSNKNFELFKGGNSYASEFSIKYSYSSKRIQGISVMYTPPPVITKAVFQVIKNPVYDTSPQVAASYQVTNNSTQTVLKKQSSTFTKSLSTYFSYQRVQTYGNSYETSATFGLKFGGLKLSDQAQFSFSYFFKTTKQTGFLTKRVGIYQIVYNEQLLLTSSPCSYTNLSYLLNNGGAQIYFDLRIQYQVLDNYSDFEIIKGKMNADISSKSVVKVSERPISECRFSV